MSSCFLPVLHDPESVPSDTVDGQVGSDLVVAHGDREAAEVGPLDLNDLARGWAGQPQQVSLAGVTSSQLHQREFGIGILGIWKNKKGG